MFSQQLAAMLELKAIRVGDCLIELFASAHRFLERLVSFFIHLPHHLAYFGLHLSPLLELFECIFTKFEIS